MPKQARTVKPVMLTGVFLRVFLLLSLAWVTVPWIVGLWCVSENKWFETVPAEAQAQLRFIERRLEREAPAMDCIFPEGRLFSYSFYGFALVNMALADSSSEGFRAHARAELERIIPVIESLADRPPFDQCRKLSPRGGIIPAGHANRLRAGYVLIQGTKPELVEAFHVRSQQLGDQFLQSPTANLETYPGMIWPVDNLIALDSLRLHDVLYKTEYAAACRRWEAWMSGHLDSEWRLMPSRITARGEIADGPRGCALSWSLAFLPGVAPKLAEAQYARYRSDWFVQICGMTAIREWPPGRRGRMDADTGPVVDGLGSAASGLGIAAAKANGDRTHFEGMLRGLELLGMPLWNLRGDKSYFFGQILLCDELALWGRTLRLWGEELSSPAWPSLEQKPFWLLAAGLTIVVALVLSLMGRATVHTLMACRARPCRWDNAQWVFLGVSLAAVLAWLTIPWMCWIYVVLLVGAIETVNRLWFSRQQH